MTNLNSSPRKHFISGGLVPLKRGFLLYISRRSTRKDLVLTVNKDRRKLFEGDGPSTPFWYCYGQKILAWINRKIAVTRKLNRPFVQLDSHARRRKPREVDIHHSVTCVHTGDKMASVDGTMPNGGLFECSFTAKILPSRTIGLYCIPEISHSGPRLQFVVGNPLL